MKVEFLHELVWIFYFTFAWIRQSFPTILPHKWDGGSWQRGEEGEIQIEKRMKKWNIKRHSIIWISFWMRISSTIFWNFWTTHLYPLTWSVGRFSSIKNTEWWGGRGMYGWKHIIHVNFQTFEAVESLFSQHFLIYFTPKNLENYPRNWSGGGRDGMTKTIEMQVAYGFTSFWDRRIKFSHHF